MNISRRNFLQASAAAGALGFLAGCGTGGEGGSSGAASSDTPLVVGYSPFSSKFSPFFAETAYDQDAQAMTQLTLYPTTRLGEPTAPSSMTSPCATTSSSPTASR